MLIFFKKIFSKIAGFIYWESIIHLFYKNHANDLLSKQLNKEVKTSS